MAWLQSCAGRSEDPLDTKETGEEEIDGECHHQQHERQGRSESPVQLRDLLLDEHRDHDVALPPEERRSDVEAKGEDEDEQATGGYPRQTEREKDAREHSRRRGAEIAGRP